MKREELITKILKFDLSRGETGRDVVLGKLTPEQADERFERDLETVMAAIDQYADQRVVDATKKYRRRNDLLEANLTEEYKARIRGEALKMSSKDKRHFVLHMRNEGYSLDQIRRTLGWKHKSRVQYYATIQANITNKGGEV